MSHTKQSVQRELKEQYAHLRVIQEKIAVYTELEAPVYLITQRDKTRQRIAELKEMLDTGNLPDEDTLEDTAAPLGKLSNVPELPPHFLPRLDDLQAIKAALLSADKPVAIIGAARKVGLQGMGGIGKSVLAAMLARDEEVRRAFPDGVFWLTLGQEPSLTTRQSQLAEALGDPPRIFNDVQQGRARLSELLAERVCLLVLDDVWQVTHAEAFNALGAQGQMLLTSRDAGLIRALGAMEHRLALLSVAEALKLLAEWAGRPVANLPIEASEVARECGNLPLALAMVGTMLRGKPGRWGNVLDKLRQADLGKIRQQFPHYLYPDLLRALHISVEALPSDMQPRYLELGVFSKNTPVPEAALQNLWMPEGLNEHDTQDIIDMLVDRSLVRRDDIGRLNLHDLQYDYVRKQASDLSALHQQMVLAYRQRCSNGWTTGPDDGYFFEHLAYHLTEAGLREELYALINKEWMDAQFKRTYSHLAFANDVEWAVSVAGAEEPPNLIQVIRNCLIYATLGELATNVPLEIVEVLAQVGQVERALGYALLMQGAKRRSEAYLLISKGLWEQDDHVATTANLDHALAVAETIEDKTSKISALGSIAEELIQRGNTTKAIEILNQMVAVVELIEDKHDKEYALGDIVLTLIEAGLSDRALKMVEMIEDEELKEQTLYEVVKSLTEAEAFDEALAVALVIEDEWHKTPALCEVAEALAQTGNKARATEIANLALMIAEEIDDKKVRAIALSDVAKALGQIDNEARAVEVGNQALAIMEEMEDMEAKTSALRNIAPSLAEAGMFNQAVAAVEMIEDERIKAHTLSELIEVLTQGENFDQAVALTAKIEDEKVKRSAFRGIVRVLAEAGALDHAITVADMIEDESHKARAFGEVAETLAKTGKFDQVLALVEALGHKEVKVSIIKLAQALVRQGDKDKATKVIDQALLTPEPIKVSWREVYALCYIARALAKVKNKSRTVQVVDEILPLITAIEDEEDEILKENYIKDFHLHSLAEALAEVGAYDQAFKVIEMTEAKVFKEATLSDMAQALALAGDKVRAAEIFNQALVVIATNKDDEDKNAFELREIAKDLAKAGFFNWALKVMDTIEDTVIKAFGLDELAQILAKEGIYNQALAVTERIEDKRAKASALSRLTQTLAQVGNLVKAAELTNQALELAEAIEDEEDKAYALSKVLQALSKIGNKEKAIEVVNKTLLAVEAIDDEISKGYALAEVTEALARINEFDQALLVAETIENERMKSSAQSKVAQALTLAGAFDQALQVAEAIVDKKYRASALSQVAQALIEARGETKAVQTLYLAINVIKGMGAEWEKPFAVGEVVESLVKSGQLKWIRQILRDTIIMIRLAGRESMFEMLQHTAPALAALDQGETLWQVYKAVMEVEEWWGERMKTEG